MHEQAAAAPASASRRHRDRRRRRRRCPCRAQPDALHACLAVAGQLEAGQDAVIAQHCRQAGRARYAAARAERRYRAADPQNRLAARSMEPSGTPPSRNWPAPKPSSPATRPPGRPRSPTPNSTRSRPSEMICSRSGTRPPPSVPSASRRTSASGRSKGRKERIIWLTAGAATILNAWLAERGCADPLFTARRGARVCGPVSGGARRRRAGWPRPRIRLSSSRRPGRAACSRRTG